MNIDSYSMFVDSSISKKFYIYYWLVNITFAFAFIIIIVNQPSTEKAKSSDQQDDYFPEFHIGTTYQGRVKWLNR